MKFLSNLHTHTLYCDGKNTIDENISEAIKKGFVSLGFSGHSYTCFDVSSCMSKEGTLRYIDDIIFFKEKYKDEIQIYLGIEGDYYSNLNKETDKLMGLDYRIGSVHYVKDKDSYYPIDNSSFGFEYLIEIYGDIRRITDNYYDNVIDMVKSQSPDIIGHLDLLRKYNKNNKHFSEDEKWYLDKIDETLSEIEKSDSIVEFNTRKMTKTNPELHYPGRKVLEKILNKNIPIVISTDAHHAGGIDYCYNEAIEILKSIGFRYVKVMIDGEFTDVKI